MPQATPAAGPLVLIVDDNEVNRRLARDVLHAAGFATVEAATGAEAVASAAEHTPAVVLLDIRLPDLDGTEVVGLLKAQAPSRPVVAFTSLQDDGSWLAGSGFDGYIAKPIDVLEFPAQVRAHCG
jgi:two-component system, cell cycle response regulator DivK